MAGRRRVPARGRRTATTLVAALVTGAVGHVVAGGTWSGPGITAAAALLLLPSWLLTAREQGFGTLVALLAGGQLSTHVTLTAMVGAAHMTHVSTASPTLPMLAAHVVATVLLAWWIRRGERRLWAGLDRFLRTLCPVGFEPATLLVRRLTSYGAPVAAGVGLLRHVVVLRGPPASTV
ncbi:hypothetical protein [Actinokineospora sp. HUAS TT18]|uniref:hypothetical protein n=1 Tax=Actinokineospora sp. HUAS TT18 TaxID=3447451 RepID=UPI003F52279E